MDNDLDDWNDLEAAPDIFLKDDDFSFPKKPSRTSHSDAWRRLFTGTFAHGRMRDTGLLVFGIWLLMGVVLFFFMQLLGFIYQQWISATLLSGYAERYVGCWFFTLFCLCFSFVRTIFVWFRYRCC